MANKLNSEFNYRTQVEWNTTWERIKILKWFLIWRIRARDLEKINWIRLDSKREQVKYIRQFTPEKEYEALKIEADVLEAESSYDDAFEAYRLNEDEIVILNKLLDELYEKATRLIHTDSVEYTDEEMFEANAWNEFTARVWKEIYAEIVATGRPSPAKLRNAMSNPQTWEALQKLWFIPKDSKYLILDEKTNNLLLK